MTERTVPSPPLTLTLSQPLDIAAMRTTAAGVLVSDLLPWDDGLDQWRCKLRTHLVTVIPAVAEAAGKKPRDSRFRAEAAADLERARELLDDGPGVGLGARTRHVKNLARVLYALCGDYGLLTGAKLLGTE